MDRQLAETRYRFAGGTDISALNTFYNKQFTWTRNYNLKWDLTKLLKLSFNAQNLAVIDELDEFDLVTSERVDKQVADDYIWKNIQNFGRTKAYDHSLNVNYTLPFKNIPFLEWVNMKASYGANYSWDAGALNVSDSLGNVIQNSQTRQASADLNFESLYNKIPYLKKINKRSRSKKKGRRGSKGDDKKGPSKDDEKDKNSKDKDKKGKKKKKKKDREPSQTERLIIRPLLMVRKARLSYSENYSTVVPGYTPNTRLFGMDESFSAPGWDFVGGLQPNIDPNTNDWLRQSADNNWISDNVFQNQQVLQNYTQSVDAKLSLEPFNDFRIDFDATRSYTENISLNFKDTVYNDGISDIVHAAPREVGSFSMSYFAMNTLFDNDIIGLFNTFEDNREIISGRLGNGAHDVDGNVYSEGFGRYQQDVLIPAFLAAYSGKDANTIDLVSDPANDLRNMIPKLNWRLTYNGLSKLPWFKDIFTSMSLTHGYKSNLTINSFNTDLDFRTNQPQLKNTETSNYYSRFEIPQLVITEQFSPLLGLDMRLKNDMTLRVDFKKSRNLAMSFIDYQLSETKTTEYVVGFGYRMKNVVLPFLSGKKRKKTEE